MHEAPHELTAKPHPRVPPSSFHACQPKRSFSEAWCDGLGWLGSLRPWRLEDATTYERYLWVARGAHPASLRATNTWRRMGAICEGGPATSVEGLVRDHSDGTRGGVAVTSMNNDPLDVSLHDDELHAEVWLTAHLIIAATELDEHLSQDEIDRLLGVAAGADPYSGPSGPPEPSD